ncbi:MAG TPA: shikimate kinase [Microlunatus sp.]
MTEPEQIPVPDQGQAAEQRQIRPIILVGPPSSGKTTVGRRLAELLDAEFIDVDEVIEYRTGKLIGEIFAGDGEAAFRKLEAETTIEVLDDSERQQRPRVISLGGGAVTSERIRQALASQRVVWLRVGIAAAAKRIGLNTARPLLLGNVRGQLIKLMREREPMYAEVATISLTTDSLEPDELVQLIIDQLAAG